MEEGVSLSLSIPLNGFPVVILREVSVPFSREFCFYGTAEVAPRKASGSRDASSHGAGHDLHISGQQVPGFIGSGEPDQARCGEMPSSWTYLRKSVILGSRGPDPVKGVVKREQGLLSQKEDAADGIPYGHRGATSSDPKRVNRALTVGNTFIADADIADAGTTDSDVAGFIFAATISSDLMGTVPPCSVRVRSGFGECLTSDHGIVVIPPLRSGSGYAKGITVFAGPITRAQAEQLPSSWSSGDGDKGGRLVGSPVSGTVPSMEAPRKNGILTTAVTGSSVKATNVGDDPLCGNWLSKRVRLDPRMF